MYFTCLHQHQQHQQQPQHQHQHHQQQHQQQQPQHHCYKFHIQKQVECESYVKSKFLNICCHFFFIPLN